MKNILYWLVSIFSITVIVSSCSDCPPATTDYDKLRQALNVSPCSNGTFTRSSSSDNSSDDSSSSDSSSDSAIFLGVGDSGNIVRSADNGSSFDNVTSPTANRLRGVSFGNDIFVAGGQLGTIVRSTDNGSSWDNVTSPTGNALYGVTSID